MVSIAAFIRKAPRDLLAQYLSNLSIELPPDIECGSAPVAALTRALNATNDAIRARIAADAQRVMSLSDEAGEAALYSVIGPSKRMDALSGGHARALWSLMTDAAAFRHAEEVRYSDDRRYGRQWGAFAAKAGVRIGVDDTTLDGFKAAVREQFGSRHVHVDVFSRKRPERTAVGDLIQATVYREGRLNQDLAFDEAGNLGVTDRYPVIEASLVYDPVAGRLEVVAANRQTREAMITLFSSKLLGADHGAKLPPTSRYDLQRLNTPFDFPTDAEDGIADVHLNSVRLMPRDASGQRVTLERTRTEPATVWQLAARIGVTLGGEWLITQAHLSIRFHAREGERRDRLLPVAITMPNGCDLKDRTERERLIGEKYLERWALRRAQ